MKTLIVPFLPLAFLVACSGGTSSGNGTAAEVREELANLGIALDASVPCPTAEPKAGGSCDSAVENTSCSYGKCTDPNGSTEFKCESDVWTVVGGSVCRSADAGSPAPACTSGGFGNAKGVCSSDESFFNSAVADCAASKLVLTAFKADDLCGAGSSSSATYGCCATVPPGGSSTYFGNANGACEPDTRLFANAEASCASGGQDITLFAPNESCGKGSSAAGSYTCTPVAGVTKPPPVGIDASVPCSEYPPNVGANCDSAVDSTICAYGKCPSGKGGASEFACVKNVWQTVVNPECGVDAGAPAPKCSSGAMDNANGACSSDESFFTSAVAECASNQQTLSAFTADEHCGAGSSSGTTYSCCSTAPNEPAVARSRTPTGCATRMRASFRAPKPTALWRRRAWSSLPPTSRAERARPQAPRTPATEAHHSTPRLDRLDRVVVLH